MKTRSVTCAFLAMAAVAVALPVNADGLKIKSVLGVQDAQTGAFRPLNRVVPDASTTVATTGTVEVTFNIKLVSTFKKGTLLTCSADVVGSAVSETTGAGTFYDETASEGVDLSGGTTATCSIKIPYSWLVPAGSSTVIDSFSGSYTVGVDPVSVSGILTGLFQRSSSGSFVSTTKIPSSGSISKYTVNVTL